MCGEQKLNRGELPTITLHNTDKKQKKLTKVGEKLG